MQFTMTIGLDGDAFADENLGPELARVLRDAADRAEAGCLGERAAVRDVNGNTCGEWAVSQ